MLTGTSPVPHAPTATKSGLGFSFPEGSRVSGVLWAPDVDRDRVEVTWSFPDGTGLRAGDRYRLTVTAPTGEIIADKEATATGYHKFEICDGACYTARFS